MKLKLTAISILVIGWLCWFITREKVAKISPEFVEVENMGGPNMSPHPLSIMALSQGEYPGSEIVYEQTLTTGANYDRYLVSYKSEGLKIYGLLTIPKGKVPEKGYPVIIFNHGYIPPAQYRTTEKYIAYTDAFSRNGYVVLKPDYRGHGNSEGEAEGGYGSNGYTIDVLNAVASIKRMDLINPNRIGMWGHSMGGMITLKSMVVSKDLKAGVIWAGVVGTYADLLNNWRKPNASLSPEAITHTRTWRNLLIAQFGDPTTNPDFWNTLSPNTYLDQISGPLQLHHGTADSSVPVEFSNKLTKQLRAVGKEVEYYSYPGDDHNLSQNLSLALKRSVEFFDNNL